MQAQCSGKEKISSLYFLENISKNTAFFGPPRNYIPFSFCCSLSLYMWLVPPWSCHYDSDGNNLRRLDERKHRTILISLQRSTLWLLTVSVYHFCHWLPAPRLRVSELGNDPVHGSPWVSGQTTKPNGSMLSHNNYSKETIVVSQCAPFWVLSSSLWCEIFSNTKFATC